MKSTTDETQFMEAVREMDGGDESAKAKVAFYKLSGCDGAETDIDGAIVLLEEGSEKGDSEAMWMLGLCCEYGIGTKQSIERAEALYSRSCEAGNVVGWFLSKNDDGGRGTGKMKVGWSLWNECMLFKKTFFDF